MKKSLISLVAIALVAASSLSQAQTPAPAAPADSLTYNMGAVTDYRYRGISQSRKQPALQGGVDFVSTSGFYVGAWA
ncbi:MAG: TorF family putative porin, partial [Betaproteobacteria bacterium]